MASGWIIENGRWVYDYDPTAGPEQTGHHSNASPKNHGEVLWDFIQALATVLDPNLGLTGGTARIDGAKVINTQLVIFGTGDITYRIEVVDDALMIRQYNLGVLTGIETTICGGKL
jgi:hypothetical protein